MVNSILLDEDLLTPKAKVRVQPSRGGDGHGDKLLKGKGRGDMGGND